MPKSTTNRLALRTRLRSRAAIATAGVCASAVLATAGVATAASASAAPSATHTATSTSETVRSQAGTQADAASGANERVKARSWMPPVTADYTLTAPFAASSDLWSATHSGQDFAVPSGTTVRAVHGGTVVKAGAWGAGDGSAYGNAIVIQHDSGTYSQYAHLSRVEVSVGEKVTTGERIARSGNTGNSTGPHLHFEIRTSPDYGTAVDPVKFLRSQHVTV
ncbi:M23 family metallopeptidase [Streptomyces sp. 6N223]|uniref:M23 family metallopeptidase n=1 Tax=Streptomyces sp. 6N223 TaxID=3457412 RepID=UPI003FD05E9A